MTSASRRSVRVAVGPAVDGGRAGLARRVRSATARSLVRIERRAASVGCAVNTGRIASRPTAALTSPHADAPVGDQLGGPVEPAARRRRGARRRSRARCTCSVMLARWKYVEKARASWMPVGTSTSASRSAAAAAVGAHQRAHLLDEVEQRLALLADEGLPEQRAEAADVGPQGGVVLRIFHSRGPSVVGSSLRVRT